ncbi:kinesin-like protein KIF16B isoform X1 [Strongylocentrotus purpuratus]|uniref:Kinesin-like protein KIF16B n=1 Tax=Strongylocentrotus purpuratus TaxID=7668 RepID=A0A7M7PSI6_STRPU|nr:kinesin-like protein KIF16B isoform X1 [Strongylocentrotus purpuratus]
MASVKVAVRVRPINAREINLGSSCIISMEDKKTSITNLKIPASQKESGVKGRERIKTFTYDYSYWSVQKGDPHFASQERVYSDLGSDVLDSAFEGYNACIFAYGQTGSGKSFTMMGVPDGEGLIPRICEGLFARIRTDSDDVSYRTEVSYLEIYCERVRDLLKTGREHTLRVREHPRDGPYVQDLSKHLVSDYYDVKALMDKGNEQRTTASTNMNDTSSRSHAIFTITFTQAKYIADMPSETVSKINLVDLAGSERANATGATGDRLKEGANINKSLVTLGNVISALADASSYSAPSPGGNRKKALFIPYRDSVLTWLLKDSLGGNSKTIMVATISPADVNYGETLSTLRYANRAKNIINKPTINEDKNVKLIRELRAEIARLKKRLGTSDFDDLPIGNNMMDKLHQNEERVKVLTKEWASKWNETQNLLKERTLALRSEGVGVVLDSEMPHLSVIDDDPLSTGLKLYHINEGTTTVGHQDADNKCDIMLIGHDIQDEHCRIVCTNGKVILHPIPGADCAVNGKAITELTKLTQGCFLSIGHSNLFRFKHPAEARRLRKELKSKSMNDLSLYRSMDNLLAPLSFSPFGLEIRQKNQEEWNRLNLKRSEIQVLEEQHKQQEAARLQEQESHERSLAERMTTLDRLREEGETAQQHTTEAERRLEHERRRLKRQSVDIMHQLEEFQKEKTRHQRDIEERLKELESERASLDEIKVMVETQMEKSRQEMEEDVSAEKVRLSALEHKRAGEVSKAVEELAKQKLELERQLEEHERRHRENLKLVDEKEAEMKQAMMKLQDEVYTKKENLQQERDEERHFLQVEKEKLEALRAKQEIAQKISSQMDDSVKQRLTRESSEIARARDQFEKLKQRQLDAIEEEEKNIQSRAEFLVGQIWEKRSRLESEKTELDAREREGRQRLDNDLFTSVEEEELLKRSLDEVSKRRRAVLEERDSLDDEEEKVEKLIQEEFVVLEQQKQKDERLLEDEWKSLLQIEAANLEFIEQEVVNRTMGWEKQKTKLTNMEKQLKNYHQQQNDLSNQQQAAEGKLEVKRTTIKDEFRQVEHGLQEEIGQLEQRIIEIDSQDAGGAAIKDQKVRVDSMEHKQAEFLGNYQEKLNSTEAELSRVLEELTKERAKVDELNQTGSFMEGQFREEQKKLNSKLESVQLLEEQMQQAEQELVKRRENFEEERKRELGRIEEEKSKLSDLENQERINRLVEEEVKKRLLEEKMERENAVLVEKESEKIERERQMTAIRVAHEKEMKEMRHQLAMRSHSLADLRTSRLSLNANADNSPEDTQRRISNLTFIETPHTAALENPIQITLPRFMQRGHGWDSYFVFELHLKVLNESWIVFRRYRRFRELHDYMRRKYKEVNALQFPPRRLFGNKSERVVLRRRMELERYLQNLMHVCMKIPKCPIAPGPGRVLSKQVVCEWSPFFRKGAFDITKYGTG